MKIPTREEIYERLLRQGEANHKVLPHKRPRCLSPNHPPPTHMVFPPGMNSWKCPDCGVVTVINVPEITYK